MTKEVDLACITSEPENVEVMKEPYYEKALKNDYPSIKTLYHQTKRCALFHRFTPSGDTVFHIVVYKGSIELPGVLFEMVPVSRKWEVLMKDNDGNTLLHEVATSENVKAAKFLVEIPKNNAGVEGVMMLMDQNNSGETPLYRAAVFGIKAIVEYLANEVETEVKTLQGNFTRSSDNLPILHIAITNEKFYTAKWLLHKDLDLAMPKHSEKKSLPLLASMSTAFQSSSGKMSLFEEIIYKLIRKDLTCTDQTNEHVPSQCCEAGKDHKPRTGLSKHCCCFWNHLWKRLEGWNIPYIKEIVRKKRKHEFARKLADMLVQKDTSSWGKYKQQNTNICILREETDGGEESEASSETRGVDTPFLSLSDTPLFIASSRGIQEIVEFIHKRYPQALEYVNEKGQNILHVAILYRQKEIFEYVKEKGGEVVKRRLVLGIDCEGDTILHKAARTEHYRRGTKLTEALKLQEELKRFQEVESMVPAPYTIHRNKKNKTAKELLEDQHKDQLENAQEWVKNTCQSCSTVAVLVATVVFAAAFTAPGGLRSDDSGRPNFVDKPLFSFFSVMDVTGLASSLTSVVLFLSVLTSSLDLEDFQSTIPWKLSLGFLLLSFAIVTTVLSFTAAIVLTVHLKKAWTTSLTYAAAFLPVCVYAIVQFTLYFEFFKSALIGIYEFVKKIHPGK